MSDFHSPSFLQVIQRPQFWIPGSAALLTLLFLGNRVLNPTMDFPETSENAGVANDRASQQLTPEQSVLGSDIDNLDVLLNELKPGEEAQTSSAQNASAKNSSPQNPGSEDSGLQPLPSSVSNTTLNLPSFTLNAPTTTIVLGETIGSTPSDATDPNTEANLEMRPAQLRNFFSNPSNSNSGTSNIGTSTIGTNTNQTTTLAPLSPTTQSTLNALPASNSRLFGSPQSLGLPQSNLSGISPTAIGTTQPLTSSSSAPPSSLNLPLRPVTPSAIPAVPTSLAPRGGLEGLSSPSANLGLPQSSNNFSSNNSLSPSPYSLDSSFTDPLAPPVQGIVQPSPALAPGQYIGNGEINTFANP